MIEKSSLSTLVDEFVIYKHSLGYLYKSQNIFLKNYINFVESYFLQEPLLSKTSVNEFLDSYIDTPGSFYCITAALREFGKYLIKKGYKDIYIIPPKTATLPIPDPPYFFTENEIVSFFSACDTMPIYPHLKGREIVLPVLFRLLYCCGLRCKEARTLLCKNVHLEHLYLDVLRSKGEKSRRIYIGEELAEYLKQYAIAIQLLYPDREYFFPNNSGYYKSGAISTNFRRFWMQAFPEFIFTSRPRAYDFRHHFAWTNLNKWADEGIDINTMIPYLMRYMGHKHISSTLYYFHFVPDFFSTYKTMASQTDSVLPEVPYEM